MIQHHHHRMNMILLLKTILRWIETAMILNEKEEHENRREVILVNSRRLYTEHRFYRSSRISILIFVDNICRLYSFTHLFRNTLPDFMII